MKNLFSVFFYLLFVVISPGCGGGTDSTDTDPADTVSSAAGQPVAGADYTQYFPLKVGHTWEYQYTSEVFGTSGVFNDYGTCTITVDRTSGDAFVLTKVVKVEGKTDESSEITIIPDTENSTVYLKSSGDGYEGILLTEFNNISAESNSRFFLFDDTVSWGGDGFSYTVDGTNFTKLFDYDPSSASYYYKSTYEKGKGLTYYKQDRTTNTIFGINGSSEEYTLISFTEAQ